MMKRLIPAAGVIAAGALALAFFHLAGAAVVYPGPKDYAAFKKEKLRLPEKNGSVYISGTGKSRFTPGEEERDAAGVIDLHFRVGDSRYVLCIPDPLPEYRLKKTRRCDIDKDGSPEGYSLHDGVLSVDSGSTTIWRTPGDWWVDDFFIGDANNDGITDLNLLVWKAGSFGPRRPFWIDGEDRSIKSHLFIFNLAGGSFKPVWQSSNLDKPNYGSVLEDINGDGKNELVVSEGDYGTPGERRVSVWRWNGWGFSMIALDRDSNE